MKPDSYGIELSYLITKLVLECAFTFIWFENVESHTKSYFDLPPDSYKFSAFVLIETVGKSLAIFYYQSRIK